MMSSFHCIEIYTVITNNTNFLLEKMREAFALQKAAAFALQKLLRLFDKKY